ncbi:VQ [Macleaya cordata]|uniref:VQ n=1 Tax=Macleaya cordata TaxID=56857 RepID=A0A200Q495_MACCD|nr:VQ [Macleaya cordata]
MDKLKVQNQYSKSKRNTKKIKKEPMKIIYISDPMMFKASNSVEFKTLVQQLTGQDSPASSSEVATEFPCIGTSSTMITDEIVDEEHSNNTVSSVEFTFDDYDYSKGMIDTIAGITPPVSLYDGIFLHEV